jgi:hypothetical protein
MRYRLSETNEKLIERLYAKAGLWSRFVNAEKPEEILRQVAQMGEPAAIPELLSILLTGDKRSVKACAETIQHLASHVGPAEFISFDEFVRQNCTHWLPRRAPWYWIKPIEIKRLGEMGEASISVLGMASFHRNGRIREGAVHALAKIKTGRELPFLLVRANDWVETIRLPTRQYILDRIQSDYADDFLLWLPLVLRLEKASRGDHGAIIRDVRGLFARSETRATLTKGFAAEDRSARRFCFDIALGLNSDCQREAILRAFQGDDVQIRKTAVNRLREVFSEPHHHDLLVIARNDSYAPVRRVAESPCRKIARASREAICVDAAGPQYRGSGRRAAILREKRGI